MNPTATSNGFRSFTFSMPKDLHDKLRVRVPGYGDRSKVVVLLIEQFLQGKITVKIPERKL